MIFFLLFHINSSLLFELSRFPKGVPWVRYYGNYKDLKLNIVCPGKDTVLGITTFLYCCIHLLILLHFNSNILGCLILCYQVIMYNSICLGVDSVGTISSSLLTYASIQALKPDLIINAGTAGGFKVHGLEKQ